MPFLAATVGPWAGLVIARDWGSQIEQQAQERIAYGQVEVGRQMLAAVAQMREAGRQRWEAHRLAASARGSGEVPQPPDGSRLLVPPGPGLSTRLVAEQLRVSPRQVRNLIYGERLSATKVGGHLLVDEVSLAEYLERQGASHE